MISLINNFIFIHVPKTGGNSIQSILINYSEDRITIAGNQDGVERFGITNKTYKTIKHSTLSHYKEVIEPAVFEKMFKFSVIRNPWERMISFYFSLHRGVNTWNKDDFKVLINKVQPLQTYIKTRPLEFENSKMHDFNYYLGLESLDNEIDFLMRFESLDDDFRKLCEFLKIPYSPLPHRNKSNRKYYSEYYDEELTQLVRNKFSEEIIYGNYTFDRITR